MYGEILNYYNPTLWTCVDKNNLFPLPTLRNLWQE